MKNIRYFHWQNLNEKSFGRLGNPIKHFRFWWWKLGVELVSLSGSLKISFGIGGEDKWRFSIGLILFTLYVSWEGYSSKDREFDLYFLDKALWFYLWRDPWGGWSTKDPWYSRGIIIHFDDLLLGKSKYSEKILDTKNVLIPMPEGSYPAKITMKESSWKRPRWFATRITRAEIDLLGNRIPHMGKGENDYDCEEDGTYSMTCCAENIEDAIAQMVKSSLIDRRKYGTPERIKPILVAMSKSPQVHGTKPEKSS